MLTKKSGWSLLLFSIDGKQIKDGCHSHHLGWVTLLIIEMNLSLVVANAHKNIQVDPSNHSQVNWWKPKNVTYGTQRHTGETRTIGSCKKLFRGAKMCYHYNIATIESEESDRKIFVGAKGYPFQCAYGIFSDRNHVFALIKYLSIAWCCHIPIESSQFGPSRSMFSVDD
jgi:hypothetical protein